MEDIATLTGTSMATPLVAGGMALYNQIKPDDSKELIFGNLINTSEYPSAPTPGFVDFLSCLSQVDPIPDLRVVISSVIEEIQSSSQNGNGFWEPGETIEILPLGKKLLGSNRRRESRN